MALAEKPSAIVSSLNRDRTRHTGKLIATVGSVKRDLLSQKLLEPGVQGFAGGGRQLSRKDTKKTLDDTPRFLSFVDS